MMVVLFIVALIRSDGLPLPVTRTELPYYASVEACKADAQRQVEVFAETLNGKEFLYIVGRCVTVTGPIGAPT